MTPAECICFKPTHFEKESGIEGAIEYYQERISEGVEEGEYFERLAILFRHTNRIEEEISVLLRAVGVFERIVFEDKLESALPVLNGFTWRLREARSLAG